MRSIAFVIPNLEMGGAENALIILANEWVKTADITIITFDKGQTFFKVDERIKIVSLNSTEKKGGVLSPLLNGMRRLKRLPRAINKIAPDVTFTFMDTSIVWTFFARFQTKVPLIMVFQVTPTKSILRSLFRPLMKVLYQKADAAVLLTSKMEDVFNRLKIRLPRKLFVIPNPSTKDVIFKGEQEREDVILGVGRLADQKQFDVLIKIYSRLQPTHWKLWIVGEGRNRKQLESLIEEYNLQDKVVLWGAQKDVSKFYARAKVFTLTSSHEGYPLVLSEAMSNGCACISFDCELGPADIIQHQKDGLLIEDQNQEAFIAGLNSLINSPEDILRYSQNAKKYFEKVDIEKLVDKWNFVVEDVLESK